MKLVVKEQEKTIINLSLPTGIITNRISVLIIKNVVKKYKINLSSKDLRTIFKIIKKVRKDNPSWTLLEVETSDSVNVILNV